MVLHRLFLLVAGALMLLTALPVSAQTAFSEKNILYHYDPDREITVTGKTLKAGTDWVLYLELILNQPKAELKDYFFVFELAAGYESKTKTRVDTTAIQEFYIGQKDRSHFFQITIGDVQDQRLLILQVLSNFSSMEYWYDFPLREHYYHGIHLADAESRLPALNNFISYEQPIDILSQKEVTGFLYRSPFPPADPPMLTERAGAPKGLDLDSVFSILPGARVQFTSEGLYFLQEDTTSFSGISFRVEDPFYPKQATLSSLIPPLVYITTRKEFQSLNKPGLQKKEFDQFWIDLTGSPNRAKTLIRNYYRRVEEANALFTTYKQGWKNDMGMMYIVFGPPDEVVRSQESEVWYYLETRESPRMRYTFVKAGNIFSPEQYVLVRNSRFEKSWMRVVDLWRKARIGI